MTEKDIKENNESKNAFFEITVKAVIVNKEGKVLVLKRAENNYRAPGKFDLPGGGLNEGESFEEALLREIKEETRLEVEIGPVIYVFDFDLGEKEKEKNIGKGVRFLAFAKNNEVKIAKKEHQEYFWLDPQEAYQKFNGEGFEKDKKEAVKKAIEYLEMQKARDNWRRSVADFENYKKRQIESQKDLIRYSTQSIVLQILPVVDNFYASTEHIPAEQKDSPWVAGIMHIQKQLENILRDNGVEEIEVKVGDEFDPNLHEAVANNQEEEKKERENKISKIVLRGYKIDDKIIRAARVIVE